MTVDEFFKQYYGKFNDFDKAYGNQCFDLFQFFNRDVVGAPFVTGNVAADIWNTYPQSFYTKIVNTPDYVPQKGDVIIWSGIFNGGPGHVAIATGIGNTNTFVVFEQNDPTGSNSHIKEYSYNYVLGGLRPKTPVDSNNYKDILQQLITKFGDVENFISHIKL